MRKRYCVIELEELTTIIKSVVKDVMHEEFSMQLARQAVGDEKQVVLTRKEVCRKWRKSRWTIIKYTKSKLLQPFGKQGREFTFLEKDVLKALGNPPI